MDNSSWKSYEVWFLRSVIHSQNDETLKSVKWQNYAKYAILMEVLKGAINMQMKFTEEQLNNLDKSLLVQMILNMQKQ